ncbi:14347_t:CDS:1, partial [Racocetra fulgida]
SNAQHSRTNNSVLNLSNPNLHMWLTEQSNNVFASRVTFESINVKELYKTNKDLSTESSLTTLQTNDNEVKHKYICQHV